MIQNFLYILLLILNLATINTLAKPSAETLKLVSKIKEDPTGSQIKKATFNKANQFQINTKVIVEIPKHHWLKGKIKEFVFGIISDRFVVNPKGLPRTLDFYEVIIPDSENIDDSFKVKQPKVTLPNNKNGIKISFISKKIGKLA